jgi:hypothetical protein
MASFVRALRPAMRHWIVALCLASAACGSPRPLAEPVTAAIAPAPPAVAAAPSVAASAAPAAAEPEPPRSFTMRTASTHYDFRLDMEEACPGEKAKPGACTGPATLHVVTKSGREVQRIDLEHAWVQLDTRADPLVNSAEVYGVQGTINVGDFDFDGREDFAVQVDQSGPYGGPTFAVFLHHAKEERFVRSEALSRLTQETLGFFEVVPAKKRLVTVEKSGCCYHVREELEVVGGTPSVVHRVTEDATNEDGTVLVIEEQRVGRHWRTSQRRIRRRP